MCEAITFFPLMPLWRGTALSTVTLRMLSNNSVKHNLFWKADSPLLWSAKVYYLVQPREPLDPLLNVAH